MESIVTAVITGVLTLLGVLFSNSRSQAVIQVKLDNLAAQVAKHSSNSRDSPTPNGRFRVALSLPSLRSQFAPHCGANWVGLTIRASCTSATSGSS